MKFLAALIIMLVPTGIVGGTLWGIYHWALTGGVRIGVALGGFILGTVISGLLYWVLWPRPLPDDLQDPADDTAPLGQQKKPLR